MLLSSFEIEGLTELLCLRPCRLPFQILPLQREHVCSPDDSGLTPPPPTAGLVLQCVPARSAL